MKVTPIGVVVHVTTIIDFSDPFQDFCKENKGTVEQTRSDSGRRKLDQVSLGQKSVDETRVKITFLTTFD